MKQVVRKFKTTLPLIPFSDYPSMGLLQKYVERLVVAMNDTLKLQSVAPVDSKITPYDRAHFKLYLQLFDAEAKGIDWRVVAADIMEINPEDVSAKACWESHLRRAKWMSETGYHQLLDSPE
ncbi:MAG: DUF2285 domain-containing protein [Rhizobiaceae bacterium]